MNTATAVAGSLAFLIIAPGGVGVLVPWWISGWRATPLPAWGIVVRVVGGLLVSGGAAAVLDSFARFALQGIGTPAPPFPPRRLVVTGLYRRVRNPMYVAVTSLIVGQGLLLANVRVLEYGALAWLGFHAFVLLYEEPSLRRRFGAAYEAYCAHVPRWLPRLRPFDSGEL